MSYVASKWVDELEGLKAGTYRVLSWLAKCHNPTNGTFPSHEYLAKKCNCSVKTIQNQLGLLEQMGLIKRNRRARNVGRYSSYRYILAFEFDCPSVLAREARMGWHVDSTPSGPQSSGRKSVEPASTQPSDSEVATEETKNLPPAKNAFHHRKKVPAKEVNSESCKGAKPQNDPELLRSFEVFWKAHPKPRNRPETLDRFREAVSNGVDPVHILAAAEDYRESQNGEAARYTSRSDNWLDQRRWEAFSPPTKKAIVAETAAFWAEKIKGDGYIPPSAISPQLADQMLAEGLVNETDLRAKQIAW